MNLISCNARSGSSPMPQILTEICWWGATVRPHRFLIDHEPVTGNQHARARARRRADITPRRSRKARAAPACAIRRRQTFVSSPFCSLPSSHARTHTAS